MKKLLLFASIILAIKSNGQISEMFDREAAYQHLNGVVLVKNSEKIVFEGCYGNAFENHPINLYTRFDIGSITKQFTAAAILQLVHTNKIKVDDFINPYLGENSSKRWEKVTIHQLLTHTSGIPSVYQTEQGLEIFMPEAEEIALADLISKFKSGKLLFSPGEEFSYSNSGYILLAAIIANVSGQSYFKYMENEVFKKYELTSTSFSHTNSNTAQPYFGYRKDLLKAAPIYHPSWSIGAGGVYSNAIDLSKWVTTINSDQFLTPELRSKFLKKHVKAGEIYYGYGWQLTNDGIIEHDGGNSGFISFLSFNPTTLQHSIILTNRSFEDIHMLGKSADQVKSWSTAIWDFQAGKKIDLLPIYSNRTLQREDFELENGTTLTLLPTDTVMLVTASNGYPSRIVQNTALSGANETETNVLEIGELLAKGKYWKLAKYCDGEMSFVCYSGLMSIGFNGMKKKVGGLQSLTAYKADEKHGLFRMKGPNGILDLIAYFDENGEVKGIFEHGSYSADQPTEMIAYPVEGNRFYLDGLPYGEQSLFFNVKNGTIEIEQYGRTITGSLDQ